MMNSRFKKNSSRKNIGVKIVLTKTFQKELAQGKKGTSLLINKEEGSDEDCGAEHAFKPSKKGLFYIDKIHCYRVLVC